MIKNIINKFLLALVLFSIMSCAELTKNLLKDPEIKILDLAVTNISAQDISINIKLNVNNPNPIPLKLGKIAYGLSFSGSKVTEGVFDKGIDIPASGANDLVIPLNFKYASLNNLINSFLKNTFTKDYELTGTADLGFFSIPFSKKGQIDIKK